jgi:hypothetical protein
MECPKCQFVNPDDFQFCGRCGHRLDESAEIARTVTEAEGERKHVTVLFSDLSGYTAMCERLDPEEVKEIMSRIFGDIAQVVSKYEGFVVMRSWLFLACPKLMRTTLSEQFGQQEK